MKRLRSKNRSIPIRFYHCGEYGDQLDRPHYHALVFGYAFPDKYYWANRNNLPSYRSPELETLWTFGNSEIGEVTFQSAGYCARYIQKKITGDKAEKHYETLDPETGEIIQLQPEYATMSRRPGIGSGWYERYQDDIYPDDFIIVNGKKMQPPKYYDKKLETDRPKLYETLKAQRSRVVQFRSGVRWGAPGGVRRNPRRMCRLRRGHSRGGVSRSGGICR